MHRPCVTRTSSNSTRCRRRRSSHFSTACSKASAPAHKVSTTWSSRPADATLQQLLREVARDEGRYCVMLRAQIQRLDGTPTDTTGVFYEKLRAREGLAAKLKLLDRGQSAVVRMIDEKLPRIADAALRDALTEMRDVHLINIARCAAVKGE